MSSIVTDCITKFECRRHNSCHGRLKLCMRISNIEILYLSLAHITFMQYEFYEKWQGGDTHCIPIYQCFSTIVWEHLTIKMYKTLKFWRIIKLLTLSLIFWGALKIFVSGVGSHCCINSKVSKGQSKKTDFLRP